MANDVIQPIVRPETAYLKDVVSLSAEYPDSGVTFGWSLTDGPVGLTEDTKTTINASLSAAAGSSLTLILPDEAVTGTYEFKVTVTKSNVTKNEASASDELGSGTVQLAYHATTRTDSLAEDVADNGLDVVAKKGGTTSDQALWQAIKECVHGRSFQNYETFLNCVLCESDRPATLSCGLGTVRKGPGCYTHGVRGYELLKAATEAFLLCHCCSLVPDTEEEGTNSEVAQYGRGLRSKSGETIDSACCTSQDSFTLSPDELEQRGIDTSSLPSLEEYLENSLSSGSLPYIGRILDNLKLTGFDRITFPFCENSIRDQPCLFELIWSYWLEEGMLVQTLNAITARFQNRRVSANGRDPLAALELNPLRPINNLLWGYIQDEGHQLTVRRRAYEYDHHYGLKLVGKAVGGMKTADPRSRFLEAFHNLLRETAVFYKEDANAWINPDTFPLLNAIRAVHLLLAEGAHNQWGDLPSTARQEMLIQQWLLSQPPMREFLQSRPMVPYGEGWMGQVDGMKKMMGWTDASVMHFSTLAIFGEQVLLSIRFGDWNDPGMTAVSARNWALFWRSEIQGYIEAYRAVTGVDLTSTVTKHAVDATLPSEHLKKRLAAQQGGTRASSIG